MSGEPLSAEELVLCTPEAISAALKLSSTHDLAHLVAWGAKKNGIVSAEGEATVFKAVYRHQQLKYEYERLVKSLEKEKIPFLPLKGSVIRSRYPEPWMRTSSDIDVLVLTHNHGDHAGGREYFLAHSPATRVITELTEICDKVSTYPMAGHTNGCIGVMDERTHTLISGDGLQGAGVDKYRCYTQNPSAYLETVKRIEGDGWIENILFSHEYEPWYKNAAYGRENVVEVLSDCLRYVKLER